MRGGFFGSKTHTRGCATCCQHYVCMMSGRCESVAGVLPDCSVVRG